MSGRYYQKAGRFNRRETSRVRLASKVAAPARTLPARERSRARPICRATGDGAVWITHLRKAAQGDRTFIKLPATVVLSAREEPADDEVAYGLRVRPGRNVVRV